MGLKHEPEKLRIIIDAYGIGVRAGLFTPCLQDENEFRKALGISAAPQEVVQSWKDQGGTRAPVTLQRTRDLEEKTETGDADNEKDED